MTRAGATLLRAGLAAVTASVAFAATVTNAAHAATATSCPRVWTATPKASPSIRDSFLKGVSALSANDAWGVGSQTSDDGWSQALVEHWDGSSWNVVPAPTPGLASVLTSVVALAPGDVWAVGYYFEPTSSGVGFVTLIEHWDGSSWTVADAPEVKGKYLNDVTASAADDVWAVGDGVAQHWDGTRWTVSDYSNSTTTASATGTGDLWAAGPYSLRHWDGSNWNPAAAAFPGDESWVQSLAGIGRGDVWGVGSYSYLVHDNLQPSRTLTVHWDGGAWNVVASPNGGTGSELYGVDAVSNGDVWAVGHSDAGALVEHWDGKRWRLVPGTTPGDQMLLDAASTPDGAVFAVGYSSGSGGDYHAYGQRLCEVLVGDAGFAPASVSTGAGKQMFWNVSRDAGQAHGVRDSSGLRLFNSGLLPPGGSYGYAFKVAGTYAVTEAPGGSRGSVRVPLSITPFGSNAFTVGWGTPDAGYVVDVQVQRPGAADFGDWVPGTIAKRGTFSVDSGPGTYRFRARLRSAATGVASDWSAVASGTAG